MYTTNGILKSTELNANNKEMIRIPTGEKVILSCAPNYFKEIPTLNWLEATCVNDQILS